MKTVMIGEKKFHLPFLDLIPFEVNQLAGLRSAIKESGAVLIPVICWKEKKTTTSETVVDGAHRIIEAANQGLKSVPLKWMSFASEEEAMAECELLNAYRRHLTADELHALRQARIERIAARRQQGESQRAIAEAEGISQAQVARDLETVSGGQVNPPGSPEPQTAKIIGKDGKQYPPQQSGILCDRCERVGAVKGCMACSEARKESRKHKRRVDAHEPIKPSRNGEELKDNHGNDIPRKCKDAWGDKWIQQTFDFLCVWAENFRKQRIADGMRKRAKHFPFFIAKDVIDGAGFISKYLDDLIDHLKTQRPDGVCPACDGDGCGDCRMSGLVPREVYKDLKKVKV